MLSVPVVKFFSIIKFYGCGVSEEHWDQMQISGVFGWPGALIVKTRTELSCRGTCFEMFHSICMVSPG